MTEFRKPQKYTTVYVEIDWSGRDQKEKITLLEGLPLHGILDSLRSALAERFVGLTRWDGSMVLLQTSEIRALRVWSEDRYR